VTLEWEETTDPDDDFSSFQVNVSDNLENLEGNLLYNTTSTSYSFTGEYDIQYWWTVSAMDSRENITWANQVYSFSLVLGFPPQPFNLLYPDSGSVMDSTIVLLEWEETVDPDDDFTTYIIYVSENLDSLENNQVGG